MPVAILPIPTDIATYLDYDPASGVLRWAKGLNSRSFAGNVAGSVNCKGYVSLKFRKRAYQAHRVAWFLMTGQQPNEIDHVDRDKANNQWANLRDVTHSANCLNRRSSISSKWLRSAHRLMDDAEEMSPVPLDEHDLDV